MNDKKWIVYKHTSPSGKVYIGITSKLIVSSRWGREGSNYKNSKLFYRAIKKYGWNNIVHEILFSDLKESKAKQLEVDLIRHYKGLGISYNITDGGQGTTGLHKTEEEKQRLREAHLGKSLSEEARRRMSEVRKGRPGTMNGKKHSEETKRKMSEARSGINNPIYGRVRTEEEKQIYRLAQSSRKKVYKINPNTNEVIEVFDSINQAAKLLGCSPSHLSDACKNPTKIFKTFKWTHNA